jgi:hypothetical protein
MKRLSLLSLVFLQFICFYCVHAQVKMESMDAYQVINKSIEAMGGKEYLQSIRTLYSEIKTEMEGRPVHWIVKEMKPNKGSFQITYNNKVVYHNWFDGQKGFEIVGGQKKQVDNEEFKDKAYKKNIFNELDYLDSSSWTLEQMGETVVNGEPCYKIRATLIDSTVRLLYYSKATFLLQKEEKMFNPEKDSFSAVLFSGYKKFGRLMYYTEMKFGGVGTYKIAKVDKLLINDEVEEKDFK